MAKYVVFPAKVWPLVVRSLRLRNTWQDRHMERTLSEAIEMLGERVIDTAALRTKLMEAYSHLSPNPANPGGWKFEVGVAESYAVEVKVVDIDALTPLQRAALDEVNATSSYVTDRQRTDPNEEETAGLIEQAEEAGMLHGIRAERSF